MSPVHVTLLAMFRAHPGRSAMLSVLPVALAGAQGLNALVHGLASPFVGLFVLGMVGFAVGATRHSLASFELESLEAELSEVWP